MSAKLQRKQALVQQHYIQLFKKIPLFDFALRLANALDKDVNEICTASPFSGALSEEKIYPTLPSGLNGFLDSGRVKTYLKNSLSTYSLIW